MKFTSISLKVSADILTKTRIFAEEKGPSLLLYAGSIIQNGIHCLKKCLHIRASLCLLVGASSIKIGTTGTI